MKNILNFYAPHWTVMVLCLIMMIIANNTCAQSVVIDVLSGTIRDTNTGRPVEGVTVEGLDGKLKVVSDRFGEFQLKNLESGSKLRFTHMSSSTKRFTWQSGTVPFRLTFFLLLTLLIVLKYSV